MAEKFYVKEVNTDKELCQFIKFPWKIYKNNPYWVPPLLKDIKVFLDVRENPFFKHADVQLFLAYKGTRIAGTIAAVINTNHNRIYKDSTGFFGFFEVIEDYNVASVLLKTAGMWLNKKGMSVMQGPMNFSIHDICGLLINNFDSEPTFMMPYNPQYYVRFIEDYGFTKVSDLFAYKVNGNNPPDRLVKVARKIAVNPMLRIRNIDLSMFDKEVKNIKSLYNDSMINNWGYLPLTDEEFDYLANKLRPLIDPELVLFAEFDGEIIGYALSLPDYNVILKKLNGKMFPLGFFKFLWNRKDISAIRIWALGVKPEFHKKSIGPLLYLKTWETALRKKYKVAEASWIHERNKSMNHALQWMGFKLDKVFRIYNYCLDKIGEKNI